MKERNQKLNTIQKTTLASFAGKYAHVETHTHFEKKMK